MQQQHLNWILPLRFTGRKARKRPCQSLNGCIPCLIKAVTGSTFQWRNATSVKVTGGWAITSSPAYREKILNTLEKYENFIWLDRLEYPDKVREFLSEIDVYALISGMDLAPLTLKEAQLMQKAVIATNAGGIPEMMNTGKTGYLVEEGNHKEIIEKLTVLLNDNKKTEKMGEEGRKFVIESFSWDLIAKKFLNVVKLYIKE